MTHNWKIRLDVDRVTIERPLIPPRRENGKTYLSEVIAEVYRTDDATALENAERIVAALNTCPAPPESDPTEKP